MQATEITHDKILRELTKGGTEEKEIPHCDHSIRVFIEV